jgi:hypothetical protein
MVRGVNDRFMAAFGDRLTGRHQLQAQHQHDDPAECDQHP